MFLAQKEKKKKSVYGFNTDLFLDGTIRRVLNWSD